MRSESDIRILRCALSTGNGELKNTSFAAQPQIGVNPAAFLIFCEAGACSDTWLDWTRFFRYCRQG